MERSTITGSHDEFVHSECNTMIDIKEEVAESCDCDGDLINTECKNELPFEDTDHKVEEPSLSMFKREVESFDDGVNFRPFHENVSLHVKQDHTYDKADQYAADFGASLACIKTIPSMVSLLPPKTENTGHLNKKVKAKNTGHIGEKPFTCSICGKKFARSINLTLHSKKVHNVKAEIDEVIKHECDKCGKLFKNQYNLKHHISRIHEGEKPFSCSVCQLKFSTGQSLKYHEMIHLDIKPFPCRICDKAFRNNGERKLHELRHSEEKPFVCQICGNSYVSNAKLRKHEVIHSGKRPFVCTICGKDFFQSRNLRDHKKIHIENRDRPYKCLTCGKGFLRKDSLEHHESLYHSEEGRVVDKRNGRRRAEKRDGDNNNLVNPETEKSEKSIMCDICGKGFYSKVSLQRHSAKHRQRNKKQCEECGKFFNHAAHLREHMRKHTGEKPYECGQCGKTFAQRSGLTYHQKIHLGIRPYACKYCDKTYPQQSELTAHERVHTGEKPFMCSVCGRKFARSTNLISHTNRVHNNESSKKVRFQKTYVFKCEYCNSKFSRMKCLKRHIETHLEII